MSGIRSIMMAGPSMTISARDVGKEKRNERIMEVEQDLKENDGRM